MSWVALDLTNLSAEVLTFMSERHLASLSLTTDDEPLHVTPVGFTYQADKRLARVITFAASKKVRLIEQGVHVQAALSQVDGGRWLTLYGRATVSADPAVNVDAEQRYAQRYRPPGDRGADRRTIVIEIDRMIGRG